MQLKKRLAKEIVSLYHGIEAGETAETEFTDIFSKGHIPDDIPEVRVNSGVSVVDIMSENNITSSKGEARRLISQGAVRINSEKLTDIDHTVDKGKELILKAGKRRFLKIIVD